MEHRSDQEMAYTPESVEDDMRQWQVLRSAAEGGNGSLHGGGGGRGDRLSIAATIADLERAADALPIQWLSTAFVYAQQGRSEAWRQRFVAAGGSGRVAVVEVTNEQVYEHMARSLGWQPTSI